MSVFPEKLECVLLAGGPTRDFTLEPGDEPPTKGLVKVDGHPLSWRTLQGLLQSQRLQPPVVVGPPESEWPGVGCRVPHGDNLMSSFEAGVLACRNLEQPALICCGDLPLMRGDALDDWIERCTRRPEASVWYGFLRKENSQARFPEVRHTWARFQDGTFCAAGMMLLRPGVLPPLRQAMAKMAAARKNVLKLAGVTGWGTLFKLALGLLDLKGAEDAGTRMFGEVCAAVETPYAELGFNVDNDRELQLARRLLKEHGDPHAPPPG